MAASNATYNVNIKATDQYSGVLAEMRRAMQATEPIVDKLRGTLGGLAAVFGVGLSIGGLKAFVGSTADAIGQLQDLSDVTGSSIEDLDHLSNVAKISGTSVDTLAVVMGKFSSNLADTGEEGSKTAKALQFLGVSARDPATALEDVAKKLQRYADGAGKAALATDIFGKQGPQMLSYLKDLGEQSERLTSVSKAQAEEVEKLDKEWQRLGVTISNTSKSILGSAAAVINEYRDNFKRAREAGLSFWDADEVSAVAMNQEELLIVLNRTKKEIADVQGYIRDARPWQVWIGATGRWGEALTDAQRKLVQLQSAMAAFASPQNMDKFDRFLKGIQGAPVGVFEQIPTRGGSGGGAKKVIDEMARINDQLNAELARSAKFWEDYGRTMERTSAINLRQIETLDQQTEALAQQLAGLRNEGEEMGLTKAQLDALTLSRLDAAIATRELALASAMNVDLMSKETQAIEDQVRLLKDIRAQTASNQVKAAGLEEIEATKRAAEDAEKAFGDMFRSIDDLAQETFASMFEGGRDVFTRLADTLKSTLLAALYQLTVRPFVIQLVASVTGATAPAASMASGLLGEGGLGSLFGGGGGSGLLGGLGSLFGGLGGGAGTMAGAFGAGLASPFSTLGGLASTLFSGGSFAMPGLALMSGLGAAIPFVGIGLALASMFGLFDKGGPKVGGSASSEVDLATAEQFAGTLQRLFTPDQEDASVQKLATAVGKGYLDAARALGLETGRAGFAFGFDTDPEGDANSRISALAMVDGREVYRRSDIDVGRDDPAAMQAALELESKRALLAALQASDLPDYLANLLDDLDVNVATGPEIDNIIATAQALKLAVQAVQGMDVAFAALSPENITALMEAFGGLENFTSSFAYIADNFTTAEQKIEQATNQLNAGFESLGIAVPDTHQAFTDLLAGMDLTSEAGRGMYASIAALAPLFVMVYGTADEAAAAMEELVDQTDQFADAADAAAEALALAIERTVELVQTQAQTVMGGIDEVVNASSGDFGEKLGLRIRLQSEQIQKLMDQYARTGLQTTLDMARQLERANGISTAQLARFTILSAQYDAERAEALVQLEDWYRAQQFALTGNTEALAALSQVFGEKWQAIIDGVAGGVGGALSELERLKLGLREWLDKLIFSDFSTLPVPEQFKRAQEQFRELVDLAAGGDLEAFAKLQGGAEDYLKLARDMFASGSGYQDVFAEVLAKLDPLAAPRANGGDPLAPLMDVLPVGSTMASSQDISDLIDYMRDRDERAARAQADRAGAAAAATAQASRAAAMAVGANLR